MPRKRRQPPTGTCTYCRQDTLLTDDHVPPRNLFPKGTVGLIKVPACRCCNNGAALDDEYFRLNITLSHDPAAAPPGSDVTLEAIAKLKAPKKLGLARLMLSQRRMLAARAPSGLSEGHAPGMAIDAKRMRRVLARTVQGLFRHHFGVPIPAGYDLDVWWLKELEGANVRSAVEPFRQALVQAEPHVIGGHVFSCRFVSVPASPFQTAWYLLFFRSFEFFALTVAPEEGA